jgi:hypothetical protein
MSKSTRFLGGAILFLAIPLGLIVRGFILSIVWRWFLTPLGMPEIPVSLAIGVALVVSFLTQKDSGDFSSKTNSDDDEDEFATNIAKVLVNIFVIPFWLLLTAWVVHQFQ